MLRADSVSDAAGQGSDSSLVSPSCLQTKLEASVALHKAACLAGRMLAKGFAPSLIELAIASEHPGAQPAEALFMARKTFHEWKEGNKRAKRDEALMYYRYIIQDNVGTTKDQLHAREKLSELLGIEKKHAADGAAIPLVRLTDGERLAAIQRLEQEAARENGEDHTRDNARLVS